MRMILGGYLETGLVRYIDAILQPNRNVTTHEYYLCLNRKVPKPYFDRAATFVALSDELIVPSIDWAISQDPVHNIALTHDSLGIHINGPQEFGGREWDDDTRVLALILIENHAFTPESWRHLSLLDLSDHSTEDSVRLNKKRKDIERIIAEHYLCRLLLQVRACVAAKALLVLGESDLRVLREIGAFLTRQKLAIPFPIPDISDRIIDADDLAGGLMNFCPPDALAMAAVKRDPAVKVYKERVNAHLESANSLEAQIRLLDAMKTAHEKVEDGRRAEKVFEVMGWCAKPLHYVPGIGEALTLAEDAKDLIQKWLERKIEDTEWYMLGVKMTDIAYKDFISRKRNLLS